MLSNLNTGTFKLNDFIVEYQITHLEFIRNKLINIEAVCHTPDNVNNKEAVYKHHTKNFSIKDDKFNVSIAIIASFINELDLPIGTLHKLSIINGKVYYIVS